MSRGAHAAWLGELAALSVLIAASATLLRVARDPQRPMLPDEPLWITAGAQAFELLIEAAGPARWETEPVAARLASFGNPNPPVGKYWIGAWALASRGPGDRLDYAWHPGDGPRESAARGQLPSRDLVLHVRVGIAFLGAGCLVLVYSVARQVTGARGASLLAPLFLLATPGFSQHATTVHTDVPQLFLLLVGVAAWLVQLRRGGYAWLALAAAALGLACATKYSSAATVIGVLGYTFLRRMPWRALLLQASLLGLGALACFWLSTPYLYTRPVVKQLAIVAEWDRIKEVQREEPALRGQAIPSAPAGLWRSAQRTLLRPDYPSLPGHGLAAGPLHLFGVWGLLGAAVLARPPRPRGAEASAHRRREAGRALLALIASSWLVTGLWLPFDWPRYYLPIQVLTPPLYAAAIAAALHRIGRLPGTSASASPG